MSTESMTLIGHFVVDSGQAIVCDPCYLEYCKPWNSEEDNFEDHVNKVGEYGYLGACNATLGKGFGQLGNQAVAFSTGYGDGLYPVYANINEDGRVTKVVIIFDDEDED